MGKILIVDDKTENLYLLQSLLETNDLDTITAKNGAEALELARKNIPDLIISDILMPVMDGFTLCRECKKDKNLEDIPFYFYTATYTDSKDEDYALSLGAERFIRKPMEPDDFIKIINEFYKTEGKKKSPAKKPQLKPESVVLKEYNEVLVRKIEDKMLQAEKAEKKLRKYSEKLEKEISERKINEASLKESKLLFQTLANVSPVGIFRTNLDGNTTFVNPKWCEIAGISQEKALGKGWLKAVHPEDRDILADKWINDSNRGVESVAEYRFIKPDGKIVWVLGKADPELTGKKVKGYIGTITDITEQKTSEEELRNSQTQLLNAHRIAHLGSWEHDVAKGIFIFNDPFYAILHTTAEKEGGYIMKSEEYLKRFVHPDDLQFVATQVVETRVTDDPDFSHQFEHRILYADGETGYVNVRVFVVKDEKGKTIRTYGVNQDITERRIMENKIIESETYYRTLFEGANDAIFIMSGDTFIECNDKTISMFGCNRKEDIINHYPWEFSPPIQPDGSDSKEKATELNKSVMAGKPQPFYWKHVKKSGEPFDAEVSLNKLELGEKIYMQAVVRDITERKKMEDKIKESEAYYRTLIDISPDGIITTDLEGNITYLSQKAYEIFEEPSSRTNIIGTSGLNWIEPEYHQIVLERFKDIITGNVTPVTREYKLLKHDRSSFWAEMSSCPMTDPEGNSNGLLIVCRDISDRKKAEYEIIRAKEKAEESDRLKTAFLHNISHEIRTPMNAIVGFSALLSEPGLDTSGQQSYIEIISQSSDQLLTIVSDIIEISNIEAGIIKITETNVNVNSVLTRIYNQFTTIVSEMGIAFTFDTPLNDSDAVINTDKTKLVQILTNLVDNAFKFTNKGQISFGYVVKKEDIEFYVSDTGIGINEELYTRIFDRFYQVESKVSRQFEGTGLGLSICKAYVEFLGGKIWLTSEVGKGSVFYFTLPYTKPISTAKAEEKTISLEKIKEERNKEKISNTILIAEDEKNNYLLLVEMLSSFNAEIIHAANGKEAVEICQEKKIDLVIMDIKMPIMDGYTATRKIKKFLPDLPVIALTAYAYESDRDKAINSGCNDYLSKPILKIMLMETVKKYL